MHPATALAGEVDVVGAVVHLRLGSGRGLEADHRLTPPWRSQLEHPLADDGQTAREARRPQLLEDAHNGDVRVTLQQLTDYPLEGIDPAGPSRPGRRTGTRAFGLPAPDDVLDRLPRQPQVAGDAPQRGPALPPPHDLVAQLFVHEAGSRNSTGH